MIMTAFTDLHMPGRNSLALNDSVDDLVLGNAGGLRLTIPDTDARITVTDLPMFINRDRKRKRADTLPARFGKYVDIKMRSIRRKLGRETSEDRRANLQDKMERWDEGKAKWEMEKRRMEARIDEEIESRSRNIVCPLPRCPRLDRIVEDVLNEAKEKEKRNRLPPLRRSWMKLKSAVSKRVAKPPRPTYACDYEYMERGPDGVERLRHITNNNAWGSHEWEYADNVRRTPDLFGALEDRRVERARQADADQARLDRRWEQRMAVREREEDRRWRGATRLFAEEFRSANSNGGPERPQRDAPSVIVTRDPEEASTQDSETTLCVTMDGTTGAFSIFDNDMEDSADFFAQSSPDDGASMINLAGSAREPEDDEDSVIFILDNSSDESTTSDYDTVSQPSQSSYGVLEYGRPSIFESSESTLEEEGDDDKESVIFVINVLSEDALVQARIERPNGGLQPSQSFYGVMEC